MLHFVAAYIIVLDRAETHCRKTLYTTNPFVEHLAVDVLPGILDKGPCHDFCPKSVPGVPGAVP
jgi:hypothetical protein